MRPLTDDERKAREDFKKVIGKGRTDAEAEVLMARISDRLGGYTHAEAVERNPWPAEEGTT